MKSNKVLVQTLMAASLALALPVGVQAQQPGSAGIAAVAPGEALVAQTVRKEATVVGINPETRTITLKGAEGRVFMVTAGDQVRNFDQIHVGDKVVADYVASISLSLKKGGVGIRERTEKEGMERAPVGAKPGATVGRQVTILANVTAVDAKNKKVTLRGPDGNSVDLVVQDPSQLALIKKGDQVEAVFTEALAIAVEPAPKAAAPAPKK